MEIVSNGCRLPMDLVIGGTCVGGTIIGSLFATVFATVVFVLFHFARNKVVNWAARGWGHRKGG